MKFIFIDTNYPNIPHRLEADALPRQGEFLKIGEIRYKVETVNYTFTPYPENKGYNKASIFVYGTK